MKLKKKTALPHPGLILCIFQADNVGAALNDKLEPGYLTNLEDFTSQLAKDAKFKPYGDLVHSYSVTKGDVSF